MLSSPLLQSLQRLWALDKFAYSLRVFVALSGVMLTCWLQGRPELVIPLFLGVIASALAETDDHWLGRLQALLVTLACFSIASLAVELLFPYPPLFVAGLALSTFAMTLLGALGERYAAIASATLILSIYTMIGVDQRGGTPADFWREPLLLVAGAGWYGLLSVLWNALFANQPVQQSLAKLFLELGEYLKIKSTLLEPLRHLDVEAQRLALARQNGRVVVALNQAKETILARLSHGRPSPKISRYLKLYFIAQDVHERASSSHYPYNQLAEAFFHSDVLFRCQRLLNQQGKACKALAKAIQLRQPFDYNDSELALADLNASLEHLRQQGNPAWRGLLRSLGALAANLTTLDRKLSGASNPDALDDEQDSTLLDRSPRSFKDALERIRLQISPTSLLFRHALRLSLALAAGYGVLHLIHPTQGYWIMLTTVFVCQPNYGATRIRLVQRILGTLVGLVAGWALIDLFPNPLIQSLLAVVAGVAFFATRSTRYTLATAAITLLVLFCFNQVGDGYGLILPRLFDTLLGALIAGIAVFLVLPDWHGRSLHRLGGGGPGRHKPHVDVQPLPAGNHAAVRQRQARRPRLPYCPAQRAQRRRDAIHHPVEHAARARPLPEGRRDRLPLPGAVPHPAQLPFRPRRAPQPAAAGRQRRPHRRGRRAPHRQPRRHRRAPQRAAPGGHLQRRGRHAGQAPGRAAR